MLPVIIPDCKWTGDAKTQTATGEKLAFGNVMSIEKDKKPIDSATRLTGSVAIRIEQKRNMKEYTFGRHWTHESLFVSALNRESIDLLKEHFRDEVPKEESSDTVGSEAITGIPKEAYRGRRLGRAQRDGQQEQGHEIHDRAWLP